LIYDTLRYYFTILQYYYDWSITERSKISYCATNFKIKKYILDTSNGTHS